MRKRNAAIALFGASLSLAGALAYSTAWPAVERGTLQVRDRGSALPRPLPRSTGAVRFVAPNGSDTGPGTFRRPWRTVQRALDSLEPGETVYVRAGVYRENLSLTRAGTRTQTITVRSYPGERVVLRPAVNDPSYPLKIKTGAAFVRVQGFVVEGASMPSTVNVYILGRAHHIELLRCEIRGAERGSGVFVDNTVTRIDVIGNLVHGNNEPGRQHHGIYYEGSNGVIANNVVYGHTQGFGIQLRADERVGPSGVVVTNNTVTRNRMGGIVVEHTAAGVTLVNNISAFNQGAGIRGYFSEEDHADDAVGIGNVVHDNLVYGNGGYGNLHSDPVDSGPSAGARILRFGRNTVADPRFLSAANADFRLRRGSPALGRAVPRYAPPFDRSGKPRRKRLPIDLGALERL